MAKTRKLPKLRKISYKNKKHHYRLKDQFSKRKLAIHEGVNMESKKTGKTKKRAAVAKKGRFNILRIYRKNKKVRECEKITHDMRYMDRKYGLGKTKNICGQKGGNGEEKTPTPTFRDLVSQTIVNNWRQISNDSQISNYGTMENMINTFVNQPRDTQLSMMKAYDQRNGTRIFQHLYEMPVESWKNEEPYSAQKEMEGGNRSKKTRKKRKTKKQFLYNPNNPKKSFDVYIDKNPSDTIPIKYATVKDVRDTIKILERLYKTKKYPHKRIWQVGMIMKVRLEAMLKHKKTKYPNAKKVKERFNLANKYFKFLGKRSKKKTFEERKKMLFK